MHGRHFGYELRPGRLQGNSRRENGEKSKNLLNVAFKVPCEGLQRWIEGLRPRDAAMESFDVY
jgi:outer membrane biogenesis lipoprotein LolB